MDKCMDLKILVKHLANGSLGDNYCIVCLAPLGKSYENVFTKVCKADKEYCVADVLHKLCHVEFSDGDSYNVCVDCFMSASIAYKFYLTTKRSEEILNFYTDELLNINSIVVTDDNASNTLCILPVFEPDTPFFDYDLTGIGTITQENMNVPIEVEIKVEPKIEIDKSDDEVVMVINELGEQQFYKLQDGNLVPMAHVEVCNKPQKDQVKPKEKQKRKRDPMAFKTCPKCPVRYRFVSKLKEHMKSVHDMVLYVCKVCKETTTNEEEYHQHAKTHTGVHECDICNTVYKKCDTITTHLKRYEEMKNLSQIEGAHICEVCGVVLESAEKLQEHNELKHVKKYTCYYCGRMYRGETSFELHIKKHEMVLSSDKDKPENSLAPRAKQKRKCMCATCGRYFVDERSLLWHQRLHTDERPYTCDVCGRGFVSMNRRNQHAVCAHTPPARRCPLCPALFHLRSMVNTHIKKVHLKVHKRRYRASKPRAVCWRTESVPLQDLSVVVQNHILELQAAGDHPSV